MKPFISVNDPRDLLYWNVVSRIFFRKLHRWIRDTNLGLNQLNIYACESKNSCNKYFVFIPRMLVSLVLRIKQNQSQIVANSK